MVKQFIEVKGVSKTYRMGEVDVHALSNVDFEIEEGKFVVILGPSGSGKSTLLNMLGGMDTPNGGQIMLKSRSVSSMTEKELTAYRRNSIGFVFQFYNLMSNLTALENVELATEICESALNIDAVMESVGLKDRQNHFPSQMSGGEQQRVAIARAVAKNPELLLCDEPTGALDYQTGLKILELLSKVNKDFNKTVVVITHNASIALMADQVIKMRSGKIVEVIFNVEPISPERIEW